MPGPPTNLQIDANGNSGYNVTVRFRTPTRPNGVLRKFIVSGKIITARKRSLGQGNIFTPVCHSVHRGGRAWLLRGGHAWLLRGGHAWLLWGGLRGCSGGACMVATGGACVVALGGHAWLLGGHAWLLGGHAWLLRGGMGGFIRGGMCGFIRGMCMVLFGGMRGFIQGGMRGFFRYNEIRSMSGRYASYWNAFLLKFSFYHKIYSQVLNFGRKLIFTVRNEVVAR